MSLAVEKLRGGPEFLGGCLRGWFQQCKQCCLGVSENSGTPRSSILVGFSIINHPFRGTPIFGNTRFKRFLFLCYSSSFRDYRPCLDSVAPLFFVRLKGLDAVEESMHRLVILKFRWFAPAMQSLGYFNANVFPIRVTSEGL